MRLYSNGQMMDLGTLGSTSHAGAEGYSINDAGQVTGISYTAAGIAHAFLYSNGQMLDLTDLIDPALGVTLFVGTGINDNGQIVAVGHLPSGYDRAFLLNPIAVPEPSMLLLFGTALLGLGVWVRVTASVGKG